MLKFLLLLMGVLFLATPPVSAEKGGGPWEVARKDAAKRISDFTRLHYSSSAYWGTGKIMDSNYKITDSLFVIGKKVYDPKTDFITDDQYYVSQSDKGISISHYTYVFEKADESGKGTMRVLGGNSNSEGTFQCFPSEQRCTYQYSIGSETSRGTDVIGKNTGHVYSEVSETLSPIIGNPVKKASTEKFEAVYLPISDETLLELKKRFGIED